MNGQEMWDAAERQAHIMMVKEGHWRNIKFVKNAPEVIQMKAMMDSNGEAIKYIDSPTPDIIKFALGYYPYTLDYLQECPSQYMFL